MHRVESGKWVLGPNGKKLWDLELKDVYSVEHHLESMMANKVNEVMFDDL